MDEFFDKHQNSLGHLRDVFKAKNVTNETFHHLTLVQLQYLFVDHGISMPEFLMYYNLEQNNASNPEPAMEIDSSPTEQENVDDILPSSNVNLDSIASVGSRMTVEVPVTITFPENDLYFLLMSTLDGRVILNRYRLTKEICLTKLKDIVIYHLIAKDPIYYEIKPEVFATYRLHLSELFPTENPDLVYVPYKFDNGQVIGAHGCFYNFYKYVRRLLRDAGMLSKSATEAKTSVENAIDVHCGNTILTDPEQARYKTEDIIEAWKNDYDERREQLMKVEKGRRTIRIDHFLNSFPCLCFPLALILLDYDFERIIDDLIKCGKLKTNLQPTNYFSLFEEKWYETASKIVSYAQKPALRNVELKNFIRTNNILIKEGSSNHIIAFVLLPFFIQVAKKVSTGRKVQKIDDLSGKSTDGKAIPKPVMVDETFNLTKEDSFNNFILCIKRAEDLQAEKLKHAAWLTEHNQPIHPYVIFVGEFRNTKAYIVFKDKDLFYEDPIVAVQVCFKIHVALRKFPNLSESFWKFLAAEVFKWTHLNCSSYVNAFIGKINK